MISHVIHYDAQFTYKSHMVIKKKKKKTIQEPHDEGIGGAHVIYMP